MELDLAKFRENLLRILKERNMSQTQLAEIAMVSRVAINRWIRMEKLPRLDTFLLVVKALDVKADDLLDGII